MNRSIFGNRQTVRFLISVSLLVAASGIVVMRRFDQMEKISYEEHLDDTVLTVDGTDYPLRALAFYIAYQESNVEEQAHVYNPENSNVYWNLYTNHTYIRKKAKAGAMEMAIHDIIFYQMALQEKVSLDEKEEIYLNNQKSDFWSDLTEEQQERICVSQEELDETFYQIALAQKEQWQLAESEGVDYREYNIDGSVYETVRDKHDYQINESLWNRLTFGTITIER